MTGLEIENFYKLDVELYKLEKNQDFLDWYQRRVDEGFQCALTIKQLQNIIDKIVLFFEFKYHNNMLKDSIYKYEKRKNYYNGKDISKMLDIEELKYRLYHDYAQFLECNYPKSFWLDKKKEHNWELSTIHVYISENGEIADFGLKTIEKFNYLKNMEGIKTVEDLLIRFMHTETKVNYKELKQLIYNHETQLLLRKKILELIPLAMIYSKNTLPNYGYIRAKSFIKMFNKAYNLNLDSKEIDLIMTRDYNKEVTEQKAKIKVKKLFNNKKRNI